MSISATDCYQLCYWLDSANDLPPSAPPPSGWSLVFAPESQNTNYAVVLKNAQTPSYLAVVIQGTHDTDQILEDFQINKPEAFVNSSGQPIISGAYIANGAAAAFSAVLGLTQSGQTLENFITTTGWSTVLITGHSLGGTIASLMGPWLASVVTKQAPLTQPLPTSFNVVTFAAFAAGNQEFASYLNGSSQYQANINVNDVVPYVWATTGDYKAQDILNTFASPGPPMPESLQHWLSRKVSTIPSGFNYIQTNEPNTFTGTIQKAPPFSNCKPSEIAEKQWEWEVSLQHNYAYCVQFIGSGCTEPQSDCSKT
jgi:hypothetical protein